MKCFILITIEQITYMHKNIGSNKDRYIVILLNDINMSEAPGI